MLLIPIFAIADESISIINHNHELYRGQPFVINSSFVTDEINVSWQDKDYVFPMLCDDNVCSQKFILPTRYEDFGKYKLYIFTEKESLAKEIDVIDKKYPKQSLKVDSKYFTLSDEVVKRVRKEKKFINTLLATFTKHKYWDEFAVPTSGTINSVFGLQRVFNGEPRSKHSGLDFRAPEGTPIHAIANGKVIFTGEHYFSGNCVYVDHGLGTISIYMHLSKILVKEGDILSVGEVIGRSGHTGRVTGPHLHLSLVTQGVSVDPEPLLIKQQY